EDHEVVGDAVVADGRDLFFFQAEDGIRDYKVTGVQTCALPICGGPEQRSGPTASSLQSASLGSTTSSARSPVSVVSSQPCIASRSEERRVGKECRMRGAREDENNKSGCSAVWSQTGTAAYATTA